MERNTGLIEILLSTIRLTAAGMTFEGH